MVCQSMDVGKPHGMCTCTCVARGRKVSVACVCVCVHAHVHNLTNLSKNVEHVQAHKWQGGGIPNYLTTPR